MVFFYNCSVQNAAALLSAERKPLDALRMAQWAQVQTYEALPGDVIVIRPIAIYGTFANDAARATAANYQTAPVGSIWYQTDTATYWQTVGTIGAVPTAYTPPAPGYYTASAPGGGGGTTATPVYKRAYFSATAGTKTDGGNTYTAITVSPTQATGGVANGPINAGGTGVYAEAIYSNTTGNPLTFTQGGFTPGATVSVRIFAYAASAGVRNDTVTINNGTAATWNYGTATGNAETTVSGVADSSGNIKVSIVQTNGNATFISGYEMVGT